MTALELYFATVLKQKLSKDEYQKVFDYFFGNETNRQAYERIASGEANPKGTWDAYIEALKRAA